VHSRRSLGRSVVTSDETDWPLVAGGDHDAFARIFDRHADQVFRFSRRRVGDTAVAEDITSQVFLETWRRRSEVTPARLLASSMAAPCRSQPGTTALANNRTRDACNRTPSPSYRGDGHRRCCVRTTRRDQRTHGDAPSARRTLREPSRGAATRSVGGTQLRRDRCRARRADRNRALPARSGTPEPCTRWNSVSGW